MPVAGSGKYQFIKPHRIRPSQIANGPLLEAIMDERIFIDQTISPTEQDLASTLNSSYNHFVRLKDLTGQMVHEWKYYSKKSGWVVKVHNHQKALFYLTPLANKFQIGMTLNEAEKSTLLSSMTDERKKTEIKKAHKYPEGYPLRFMVESENELNQVVNILNILNKI